MKMEETEGEEIGNLEMFGYIPLSVRNKLLEIPPEKVTNRATEEIPARPLSCCPQPVDVYRMGAI